jgi:hypothetical protein
MTPTHPARCARRARGAGRGRLLGPLVAVAVGALSLLGQPATARAADAPAGTTYYVDSRSGDDGASGTSAATPWQSLDQVNRTTFRPGDRILLKAGGSW